MATNTVSFFAPGSDAELEKQQIDRQRQMAALLMQRATTPEGGQMVSGHYVAPGWASSLSQILAGVGSHMANKKADEQQKTLGDNIRSRNAADVQGFVSALQGTPAKTIAPLTPNDDEGNPMPAAQQAAVPGDRAKALALALGSQNPMLQQAGNSMLASQLSTQELTDKLRMIPGFGGMQATEGASSPGVAPTMGGGSGAIPFGGANPTAVMSDIAFNGGKGIGSMVADANKPIAMREGDLVRPNAQGGFSSAYQSPKMDPGFIPQRDAQGQVIGASVIPGYAEGVGRLAGIKAGATAGANAQNEMISVDTPQGPRLMTRAQAVQLAGGAQPAPVAPQATMRPQALPAAGSYSTEGQMKATAQGDMGFDPAAAKREIAALQSDLTKVPDDASKQMIADEIKRLQGQVQRYAGAPAQPSGPGIALQDESSKKFGQTVASQSAEALLAGRDKAKSAVDDLMSISQARKAIQDGAFQGSGADTKLAIAKFVNSNIPGVKIDPEKVGNTDYLKSTLGAGVLAQAKSLGANPSNADAERINDIVGSIGKDPQAMKKLLDWRETMAKKAIDSHNGTVMDAEGRGMKSPYDLRVKAPEQAAPTASSSSAAPKAKDFKSYGYASPADALADAQRALQANPGAKAEIMKRLNAMGVQIPQGAQGGW